MTQPEIPDALLKFAQGLLMDMDGYGVPYEDEDRDHDAGLIAAALLAERNRTIAECAGIADRYSNRDTGYEIAADIRALLK